MTSSSRTDPPGSTTAFTPASPAPRSRPGTGRTRRSRRRFQPPVTGAGDGQPRRVDPVDLAHPDADGGTAGRQQDRVGLGCADRAPGEAEVSAWSRRQPRRRPAAVQVGRIVAGRRRCGRPPAPASRRRSGASRCSGRDAGGGHSSSRIDGLRESTSSAPSSYPGAQITSVKISGICSASPEVTGRLVAMTPPKALTGSQAWALRCASASGSSVGADRDAARVRVLDDRHARLGES